MTEFWFSTDDIPERDRIAVWREVFGRNVAQLDMAPPRAPFHATVRVKAMPHLAIGSTHSSANRIARTRGLIADGNDDVMLGILTKGQALVSQQGGDEVLVGPGEAVVWSNGSIGHSAYAEPIEFLSAAIPRAVLVPSLVRPDNAGLRVIPRAAEGLGLLAGYLLALLHEPLSPEVALISATHVHDLAAIVLGAGRDAMALAGRRGQRAARLRAVKDDIRDNLGRRDLTLDALAIRHGVSPRTIRELFGSEETTFTDYVLNQRLSRVHRLLGDPRHAARTISSIAYDCGFGDLSYFNHAFRRRYGATPSDVRAAAFRNPG